MNDKAVREQKQNENGMHHRPHLVINFDDGLATGSSMFCGLTWKTLSRFPMTFRLRMTGCYIGRICFIYINRSVATFNPND